MEKEFFYEFTKKIGLDNFKADIFRQICQQSIEAVRKAQLNSYTTNAVWWARDEWRKLEKTDYYCATIYTDLSLWNKKEESIGELVERLKKLLA